MQVIDIRTFMLVLAIGNIAFAMLMAGYARSGRELDAMRLWKRARLIQGLAHLLSFLRLDYPSVTPIMVANTVLLLGAMLEVAAYCTFFGQQRWKRVLYPLTVLALVVFNLGRYAGLAPGQLIGFGSVIIALLSGAITCTLLSRRADASVLQRIIAANNLAFFALLSVRAVVVNLPGASGMLAPALWQASVVIAAYLLMIVNGFGFLLLCKESDDRQLALLATTDSLTGLVNRRAFFERTESARQLATRQRIPVALMMLDLDHFKGLNDRHGHAAGDEALRLFASTAQGTLRDHDIMGRLGGEEFALVLPGTDLEGAMQAAERLRLGVQQAGLVESSLPDALRASAMTVSIGVVLVDPHEHINAALARADRALYAAKSAGRNRVEASLAQLDAAVL